ncbi:MAG: ribonuclease P protein subunit, partial [Promethearchaeota archaeon]
MTLDPKYLIYHDLIGIQAFVGLNSKKSSQKFSDIGKVIDETRNMLITEKNGAIKKYIKKDHLFRFKIANLRNDEEDYLLEVPGIKIVGLPVNR